MKSGVPLALLLVSAAAMPASVPTWPACVWSSRSVAQYGMYADLLAYMRRQTGGKRASRLLWGSAEAYLRTWRRATR